MTFNTPIEQGLSTETDGDFRSSSGACLLAIHEKQRAEGMNGADEREHFIDLLTPPLPRGYCSICLARSFVLIVLRCIVKLCDETGDG